MWVAIIGVVKLVAAFLNFIAEKNEAKKIKKAAALKEMQDGIKNKDATAITAAFDRINRM